MLEWDPGPPPAFANHFENRPNYTPWKKRFRMAWGPIFYRGRLDGSAKVIVIGQDPATDEDVARRTLVGDAGQKVQGFLSKLGLVRSYAMVNTFLYGLKGQADTEARQISSAPAIKAWRNTLPRSSLLSASTFITHTRATTVYWPLSHGPGAITCWGTGLREFHPKVMCTCRIPPSVKRHIEKFPGPRLQGSRGGSHETVDSTGSRRRAWAARRNRWTTSGRVRPRW